MKSRTKKEIAPQEMKVIIYEKTGAIGKSTGVKMRNALLALHNAHPELYKKFQQEQAKNA